MVGLWIRLQKEDGWRIGALELETLATFDYVLCLPPPPFSSWLFLKAVSWGEQRFSFSPVSQSWACSSFWDTGYLGTDGRFALRLGVITVRLEKPGDKSEVAACSTWLNFSCSRAQCIDDPQWHALVPFLITFYLPGSG